MILREKLKAKIDRLDKNDLRIVNCCIDFLNRKKTIPDKMPVSSIEYPYQQILKLMGNQALTSNDVNHEREDRL